MPGDGGTPAADGPARLAAATAACSSVRTLTAEASLAGRIDGARVRGRLLAGLDRAGRLRIEALAPFGAPVFVLVADADNATLLVPREGRVLTGAPVEDVLEAVAGLPLGPADLLAVLSGCAAFDPAVSAALVPAPGWTDLRLPGGDRLWLRQTMDGVRVVAATRGDLSVEYEWQAGAFPAHVIVSRSPRPGQKAAPTRFTLSLSQVEANVDLPASAFHVDVPGDARPLSLDELRRTRTLVR